MGPMNVGYQAIVSQEGEEWKGQFLDFPGLTGEGHTREELTESLTESLKRHHIEVANEREELPAPQATAPPGAQTITINLPGADAFSEKASEKLLDTLKADFDRAAASNKLFEDRARANGTLGLAALPILALLRTQLPNGAPWWLYLVDLTLVLGTLGLMLYAARTEDLQLGDVEELQEDRTEIYLGYSGAKDTLDRLQGIWLTNAKNMSALQAKRADRVIWQEWCLVALALLVSVTLGWSFY